MSRWAFVALLILFCAHTALGLPPSKYRGRGAIELETVVLYVFIQPH